MTERMFAPNTLCHLLEDITIWIRYKQTKQGINQKRGLNKTRQKSLETNIMQIIQPNNLDI